MIRKEHAWYQDTRWCVVRPKKPARHTVGILTGRKKTSPLYLGDNLSDYNQIGCQSCLPTRGVHIPNLKVITIAISEIRAAKVSVFLHFFSLFFVFSHTCKNCYKTQARTPIALKLAHRKGVQRRILASNLVQIQ